MAYKCTSTRPLLEAMTYDQLLKRTDMGRRERAQNVRGPALDVYPGQTSEQYFFNFKAYPSTEGKRHRGYVKFFKPSRSHTPLQNARCEVDCDCKDYRFRWAWANKQRGAGRVGPGSLNKAHNRAPRKTNPTGKSSLCKHLVRVTDYIYDVSSKWDGMASSDADKFLQRLVRRGEQKLPGEVEPEEKQELDKAADDKAKSDEETRQMRQSLRANGQDPDMVVPDPDASPEEQAAQMAQQEPTPEKGRVPNRPSERQAKSMDREPEESEVKDKETEKKAAKSSKPAAPGLGARPARVKPRRGRREESRVGSRMDANTVKLLEAEADQLEQGSEALNLLHQILGQLNQLVAIEGDEVSVDAEVPPTDFEPDHLEPDSEPAEEEDELPSEEELDRDVPPLPA